jgi:hypothetical protein
MEENVRLLTVNWYVCGGSIGNRIRGGRNILSMPVLLSGLRRVCFDALSKHLVRSFSVQLSRTYCVLAQIGIWYRKLKSHAHD